MKKYDTRFLMSELHDNWTKKIKENAGAAIDFKPPYCGIYCRKWNDGETAITLEADPGYHGIGAALTPEEALKMGEALIRAARMALKGENK